MKAFILLVFLICCPILSPAQNATITIGRGTDCFGRGACSISTERVASYNASLLRHANGKISLRFHRSKLTKNEEDRIFGEPIFPSNENLLEFELFDYLPFSESVKRLTSPYNSEQLDGLPPGLYPTQITETYIEITLEQ